MRYACTRTRRPWTSARATTACSGSSNGGSPRDPLSGELYLFVNKRRDSCKVLVWDGTGLCIFQKRLERGRFASPWRGGNVVRMTASELALFIEGCELVGHRRLSPDAVVPMPLGG